MKDSRNSLGSYQPLSTIAAVLYVLLAVGCTYSWSRTTPICLATTSTVVFDLDTGSPPPSLYRNTPFEYVTTSGISAHFSSPSDTLNPAFSVQSAVPTGYNLSMFSGKWLYDNQLTRDYLDIRFSAPISSIRVTFAIIEQHGGPGTVPSYLNLTAYLDSIGNQIGSAITRGRISGEQNTQGELSFSSDGRTFNLVRIGVPPNQPPFNPTDFFVDNIVITAAPVSDTAPPVTTISFTGDLGNEGWYRSNVTTVLSATDDLSGVNKTEYSFDNTNWTLYAVPFLISTQGTSLVYYRSTDAAGNVETPKTQTIKVDTKNPLAQLVSSPTTAQPDRDISFDGSGSTDNIGVVSHTWDFGDGSTTATGPTATHKFPRPGTYTVTLTVKDAADNSNSRTVTVTIEAPVDYQMHYYLIAAAAAGCVVVAMYLLTRKKVS